MGHSKIQHLACSRETYEIWPFVRCEHEIYSILITTEYPDKMTEITSKNFLHRNLLSFSSTQFRRMKTNTGSKRRAFKTTSSRSSGYWACCVQYGGRGLSVGRCFFRDPYIDISRAVWQEKLSTRYKLPTMFSFLL